MRQLLCVALIAGFLGVDFLFFHDVFKAGESPSAAQYLTGLLSLGVFAICAQSLLARRAEAFAMAASRHRAGSQD